ncbi:nucleotide sugar dehydrogenase [Allocatelliglobosispora scoriae]|uniref:Nucleotide sugar dehydrogenase n=1 Tax=Allocatelliglobosispora scoriae TaxID=643052 RepID=A0A841BP29_9ACTN|nr:nucleotide sugar dehydrogenase [Allocatelliglobosispora scoriae]MBB5870024.1 nucleotide sugar dehydrogenase [Allocatelliglobosispora scoriae]
MAVCGLGYVGLALARDATAAGLTVVGYDIDESVVADLIAGRSHIDDVLDEDLAMMLATGFTPSADPAALGLAPVVVVCVPTPLDRSGGPDLGAVYGAITGVANRLLPGMLVVLESTSYPGTTEEVVLPILERVSGLKAGVDFNLAFSPERIDPGNAVHTMSTTPKIVGGFTPACTERAEEFYGRFTDTVVRARGTREAEMAKLLENTYRYVNIGLVNEMAMLCHRLGIDIWDVIECAGTKPFGFQAFQPGPGVGGHCIPVDPLYLAYKAREAGFVSKLIDAADQVNANMPRYVVHRAADLLQTQGRELAGSELVLLGVTYKADIRDLRMSPAYAVARELRGYGASVSFHDPFVDEWTVDRRKVPRHEDLSTALRQADMAILLQKHTAYEPEQLAAEASLLFDARGLLADLSKGHVEVL